MRSFAAREKRRVVATGAKRVGTARTSPSGSAWSAPFQAMYTRLVASMVGTISSSRPVARASAAACGLLATHESGPPSSVKPSSRSVMMLPPRRRLASSSVTSARPPSA
jgi:hypothetical protein